MTRSGNSGRPDVAALARAGDRDGLRRALAHGDAAVRARAADALAALGDVESARLLRAAVRADEDDHVREESAVALGRLGDPHSVDDLIGALQRDGSPHVREEAAVALGRLGDERATEALLGAMGDSHRMVHRAAVQALGGIGEDAMRRLRALADGPSSPAADAARAALQDVAALSRHARRHVGLDS